MSNITYKVDDEPLWELSRYAVGFIGWRGDESIPCGSGTMVDIDGARGFITAAHVLDLLLEFEWASLCCVTPGKLKAPDLQFETEFLSCFSFGTKPWSNQGPDLAFIWLPIELSDYLNANMVFYNFALRDNLPVENIDLDVAIIGMPAEKSDLGTVVDGRKNDRHIFDLAYAKVQSTFTGRDDFDLFTCDVVHNTVVRRPAEKYGGMSGGGVWAFGAEKKAASRIFLGVMFYDYENEHPDPVRLVCHGPGGIYDRLRRDVANKEKGLLT